MQWFLTHASYIETVFMSKGNNCNIDMISVFFTHFVLMHNTSFFQDMCESIIVT